MKAKLKSNSDSLKNILKPPLNEFTATRPIKQGSKSLTNRVPPGIVK